LDLFESLTASGELGDNRIDGGGPDERPGTCIPGGQKILNRGREIGNAKKGIAADALVGQLRKPTLDEVEPTATGGHAMQDEAGMLLEPSLDLDGTVSAVIVDHQMERRVARKLPVDASQKFQELLMPVPRARQVFCVNGHAKSSSLVD
jgi:hypothetical protein